MHIAEPDAWRDAAPAGVYRPRTLEAEGFIHCSTPAQTVETANRWFRGVRGLTLLCIDEEKLVPECRYEAPAGGSDDERSSERFPHIYGPLNLDAVVRAAPFPCGEDGRFELPSDLEPR